MVRLASDFPVVTRTLLEAEQLKEGRIEPLVRKLRREILKLTQEPAWSNHWSGESDIPDFSHVQQQFSALLAAGQADAVLDVGDELWRRGNEQVAESNDEGETGEAIAQCLEIVLRALPCSSLSHSGQVLWVIDRLLADEYGLLHSGEKMLDDPRYGPEDWRQVAAALEQRFAAASKASRTREASSYRQTDLQGRLINAYRRSGQVEKIVPLLESNADRFGNYSQLVDLLVEAGDEDRARQWCLHGFARTVEESIGAAERLQERLRLIAERRQQHDLVAAHRAEEFFRHPCLASYQKLQGAAEKLGCWPQVRKGALGYLESGRRPDLPTRKGGADNWPLPAPEVRYPQESARSRWYDPFPQHRTLIDIAIAEQRFDNVVALYQSMRKGPVGTPGVDQTVAKAVAKTHPEVALTIWRRMVDGLIAQVKPRAYIEAGGYLRLMHKVFKEQQRLAEWNGLLAELRKTHKAKRRLLEVLDGLAGSSKKIVG